MVYGITDLTTYVLGTIFIVLLPGPNSLYVLSVASQRGVRAGYLGACGIFVGDAILMVLSATGVASLLQASPALFMVLKYVGAAYLAWLGIGLLRAAWAMWQVRQQATASESRVDATRPFHAALVISLMNPKAIMFFVSFFIQFVDPGYAYPALSFAILGLICQIISGVYLSVLILGGAHLAQQFRSRRRLAAGATGGVGAMFIGFGARLADSTLN
ncbi:leucine efflux protein LeuE [Sulfuritalea hydrogenivorans]|jgi:leucine efflux protein|uniref:Leucine export protein leue n=1 Tax=Sulfuritalea hydrogenivorans sk43H TaxID=1223802 RepID=W0SED5_9PROT|nr:leucine efflux protein LeuE [Sulfuritalea hydrogenivorans]MDK9713142.1 leucine efflux protein LeuE [Sulfuritalea sp.]BAO29140.1 leucine export protein leue [Sulfuritalea hydrogenivorans sk43H]